MTPGNDISNGFPSESSSNLLNSIIKIIPDAAVILDFDGKIIECNQLVCNMIGKERAEIIGLSYQAVGLFSETDFSQYMKLVETMQYDKGYPEREIEWIAPSGNIRKSEVHLGLLNLQPLPQSIIAIARDVSTRYSIEERLKNEREAFHLIAEAAIESKNPTDLCDQILAGLVNTLEYEKGTLRLYDKNENVLLPTSLAGVSIEEGAMQSIIPLTEEMAKSYFLVSIIFSKSPLFAGSLTDTELTLRFADDLHRINLESIVVLPLFDEDGSLLGALTLTNSYPRSISEAEREFFYTVSDLLVTAIRTIQTQRDLEDSRVRLDLALKGADLGVWEWNLDTEEMFFSERWAEILGYSLDELETNQNTWISLLHPDDLEIASKRWDIHVKNPETTRYSSEHRMRTKSGDYKWVLERGRIVSITSDDSDRIARGTMLDIDERRKAENAIRSSELKYRTLIEQSVQGVVIVSQDPILIVYANPAFCHMLNMDESELLGFGIDRIREIIHPDDFESIIHRFVELFSGAETESTPRTLRLLTPEKKLIWVDVFGRIIEYEDLPAMQITFNDITEQHRAEEALKASESKYRSLAESSIQGIIVLNHGRVAYTNPAYREMVGYTEEELNEFSGDDLWSIIHLEDRAAIQERFQNYRETGKLQNRNQYRIIRKDGEIRWVEASAGIVEFNGESAFQRTIVDITERKEAEDELKKSEAKFRTLVQSMHDIVLVFDGENKYSQYYTHDESLLYVPPRDFMHRYIGDVLPFSLAEQFIECIKTVRETGQSQRLDYPIDLDTGEKWFSAIMSLHEDNSSVVAVLRNITDRVLAEKALERERGAFRMIAEASVQAGDTSELSRKILKGLCDSMEFEYGTLRLFDEKSGVLRPTAIVGYKPETLVEEMECTENTRATYLVVDVALSRNPVFAPTIMLTDRLNKYQRRFDELGLKSLVIWPVQDDSGNLLGVFSLSGSQEMSIQKTSRSFYDVVAGFLSIILKRKKIEDALRISERRYHELIEDMTAGIGITDLEENIVFVNRVFAEILGYTQDELIGIDSRKLVPPNMVQKLISETQKRKNEEISTYHLTMLRKDGEERIARVSAVPSRDDNGVVDGTVALIFDITDMIHADEEIRRLNRNLSRIVDERTAELQAANKELEAFAYSISHDLRAPLRSIDGFSLALMEDYSNVLDEVAIDYLKRVRNASSRMTNLIEALLSLSRVTRGELDRGSVNLSHLAEEAISELSALYPNRRIQVTIESDVKARSDRRMIRAVLQNLIENAWKFTKDVDNPRIEFGHTIINNETVYYVRDNGIGFDMSDSEKLFKPFYRLHTGNEYEGSGIGLATIKRIIDRHGGRVWTESIENEGTTFYFTLPSGAGI